MYSQCERWSHFSSVEDIFREKNATECEEFKKKKKKKLKYSK